MDKPHSSSPLTRSARTTPKSPPTARPQIHGEGRPGGGRREEAAGGAGPHEGAQEAEEATTLQAEAKHPQAGEEYSQQEKKDLGHTEVIQTVTPKDAQDHHSRTEPEEPSTNRSREMPHDYSHGLGGARDLVYSSV